MEVVMKRWTLGWMARRIVRDIIAGHAKLGWAPWWIWKAKWLSKGDRVGLFRNRIGVVGFRWGFCLLGFEFGNRSPGRWPEDHGRVC